MKKEIQLHVNQIKPSFKRRLILQKDKNCTENTCYHLNYLLRIFDFQFYHIKGN